MENVFLGLIAQQWQGVLRYVLNGVGALLIAKGVTSPDAWHAATPIITTIVGSIMNLASLRWTVTSNKADTIISTADKLQGK